MAATGCPEEGRSGQRENRLQAQGEDASRWPALPGSSAELDALLDRYRRDARRAGPPPAVRRPEELAALVRSAVRSQAAVAGWARIEGWLHKRVDAASAAGRRLFLLWGVHHDSAGQVVAFRRLALASTREPFDLIVSEHFDADGQWAGVSETLQRGDDDSIDRFVRHGSVQAWRHLRRKQQRDNFTARKYGYLDQVLGLAAVARRRKRQLVGCDMNVALRRHLRRRLSGVSSARHGDALLRLRELHCWLALQQQLDRAPPVRHVAMLWGQSHIDPGAFPGLVPQSDEVISVYVLGQRLGACGIEKALPKRLQPLEPLLLPIDAQGHQAVLLLPDRSER